jgi:hypothetical protein
MGSNGEYNGLLLAYVLLYDVKYGIIYVDKRHCTFAAPAYGNVPVCSTIVQFFFVIWGGVKLSLLGTSATISPIVPAPKRGMIMSVEQSVE